MANVSLIISVISLLLASFTFYRQHFYKAISVTPHSEDGSFYFVVKNIGHVTVSDFKIEITNTENLLSTIKMEEQTKGSFLGKSAINGVASHTLDSKDARKIRLGDKDFFKGNGKTGANYFPVIEVKIKYSDSKRDSIHKCDFNIFRNENRG